MLLAAVLLLLLPITLSSSRLSSSFRPRCCSAEEMTFSRTAGSAEVSSEVFVRAMLVGRCDEGDPVELTAEKSGCDGSGGPFGNGFGMTSLHAADLPNAVHSLCAIVGTYKRGW